MNRRKISNHKGITLIALVISIIVMLILAGVSLNATIGDNGIITKASDAKMQNGMAVLEEYLQQKYVEYYDETENYSTKIDLINAKIPNLLFKNGTKNYFVYENKTYYLLNKASLPEEIQNGLIAGNTTEIVALKNLYDVYGINPDLSVYYIDKQSGEILGNAEAGEIDKNSKAQQIITGDSGVYSCVNDTLKNLGIEVDPEIGITVGNIASIKEITLDGSLYNISNLSSISELTSLKKIILKDLRINNLNGLENCLLTEYIFFDNCVISDSSNGYNSMASLTNLKTLYMCLPSSISESDANAQVLGLSNGLHNAIYTNKLTTFGIFGTKKLGDYELFDHIWVRGYLGYHYDPTVQNNLNAPEYTSNSSYNYHGNLSEISSLDNIADNIKSSVLKLYLNHNNLNSISGIRNFSAFNELWLWKNDSLTSLSGLENHTALTTLLAPNCGLINLNGLEGCSNLNYILINGNKNLSTLNGIENVNLTYLYAMHCTSLTDISSLQSKDEKNNIKHKKINRVLFINNSNLEDVSPLAELTSIRYLFLKGCKAIETSYNYWIAIDPIVELCGNKCSLPEICNNWLSNSNVRNYAVEKAENSYVDNSTQIESLRNKTKVTRLSLKNNAALSDDYLNEILSTMTGMEYLQLYGCSNLTKIDFATKMPNLKELDIRGTSITDLTKFDNYIKNKSSVLLQTIVIDNTETDMKTMQNIINRIQHGADDFSSWVNPDYVSLRAVVLIGTGYDFTGCTTITRFDTANYLGRGTIDLSPCTNLTSFSKYGSSQTYILPKNLTSYFCRNNSGIDDMSHITGTISISSDTGTNNLAGTLATINVNATIYSISHSRFYPKNFDYLKSIPSEVASKVSIFDQRRDSDNYFTSLSGLEVLTGLKSLTLQWGKVEDFSNLSNLNSLESFTLDYIESNAWNTLPTTFSILNTKTNKQETRYLTTLSISNSNLNNTIFLNKDNRLTTLYMNNNKISNITGLNYCKNLETLSIKNNSISNIVCLRDILVIDSEKTTDSNNTVYTTTLKNLYLDSNPIGNESVYEYDNLSIIELLKKSGVTTISLSGITFSN